MGILQKKLLEIKDKNNHIDIEYEKWLFHGTRKTDPKHIYNKGFDMRLSQKSLWGEGIYFAVNASYSDAYCYNSSEDRCSWQKLLLVITLEQKKNNTFKHPPYKDQVEVIMYDSVMGNTGGSDVFII